MSGLRREELVSLAPESFRLDGGTPMVVCEAGYTKNHETAEQPLPDALVSTLRPWLATKQARQPIFAAPGFEKTGMMLKLDLERCGIPFEDESGRVVDLHSLRHGYISSLANAGTPIKTLQTLARHADPRLTLNTYGHVSLFDTGKAIGSLADPFAAPQKPQRVAATGTNGRIAHRLASGRGLAITDSPENPVVEDRRINEPLAHYLPTAGVANCVSMSRIGESGDSDSGAPRIAETPRKTGILENSAENRGSQEGWMTGFEPAIPRSTIWCLNR
jgi:hypothetical protein